MNSKLSEEYFENDANDKNSNAENKGIIEVLNEKNALIEKYRNAIEDINKKHKVQLSQMANELNKTTQEVIGLKSRLMSLQSNDVVELMNYYEKEIIKIISTSDKIISDYKNKISLLMKTNATTQNTQLDKMRKVIEMQMQENSTLKEKNNTLWKINRMNEAYKSLTRQYGEKICENKKTIESFQKEQISQLTNLTLENKKLKEENGEKEKVINNLLNTIELYKAKFNENCSKQNINNINNNILNLNKVNQISPNTRKLMMDYLENRGIVDLDNYKLDRYLNSCKLMANEKLATIHSNVDNIELKINKENSVYKKIIQRSISDIREALKLIAKEITSLIKKSNSSFLMGNLTKSLLKDVINEVKDKSVLNENLIELSRKYLIS